MKGKKTTFEINWSQKPHRTALITNVVVKGESFYSAESTQPKENLTVTEHPQVAGKLHEERWKGCLNQP